MTDTKKKCDYIALKSGLAIRRTPNSKNWGVYLKMPKHKPLQFSLKTPDKDEAIEKAWEEYSLAKIQLRNGEPLRQPKQRLTLHQIIDELVKEHEQTQSKRKSKETEERKGQEPIHATHIRLFKRIKDFYESTIQPTALDMPKARAYFAAQGPFSTTQLTATRYCFTQIFDRSFEKKLISKDQVLDLTKIKVEIQQMKRRDHLTKTELAYLVFLILEDLRGTKKTKQRHVLRLAMFYYQFLYYSGIRAGNEAFGIKWGDFDFNKNNDLYCIIRKGKTENYKKNNRYVIFDIMAEDCLVQYALRRYEGLSANTDRKDLIQHLIETKPNDVVFSTKYSNRPTFGRIFTDLVKFLQENEYISQSKIIKPYSLRHSYITQAIENDVPYPLIAENAGTSVSMIEKHYSHVSVMTDKARQTLLRDKMSLIEIDKKADQRDTREKVADLITLIDKQLN